MTDARVLNDLITQMKAIGYKGDIYEDFLSELISEIGYTGFVMWELGGTFHAGKDDSACRGDSYYDDYPRVLESGKSPEEAAARLWLSLQSVSPKDESAASQVIKTYQMKEEVIFRSSQGVFLKITDPTPRERHIFQALRCDEFHNAGDFMRDIDEEINRKKLI